MPALHPALRALVQSGPMAHLSTINRDGSPQATVIWIGLDGDDIVSGHMARTLKIRNVERDPRVVLSFDAPREPGVFLNQYATLKGRARVEAGVEGWELLDRLSRVYMSPDATFPAPRGEGFVLRYAIERVGGVGPWAARGH